MRILFLTHRLPYAPNRGDRIRSYHMLRELAKRAEVELVSLVHDQEEESQARDLPDKVEVTTARVPRFRNLVRGLAALGTDRPLTHVLLDAPAIKPALARSIARRPPDVVLAYGSGMARFALEAPLERLPLVLDMVDVDSEKWRLLGGAARGPRRWIYLREGRTLERFETTAVHRAQTTLVVNARERASLLARLPRADVRELPMGVDLEAFRAHAAPVDEPRVVFCGVLNYQPNEDGVRWFAREVWPLVRASRPDARLSLVGSNPTRAVRALGKRDASIEITGTVPDIREYLWRSAVAVAPIFVARGVQTKVLEATAAGLPSVVTSTVCEGLPSEVRPACAVADTQADFARVILELLARGGSERRRIAQRANVSSLGWSEQLAPLFPILEAAVHGGQRRLREPPSGP